MRFEGNLTAAIDEFIENTSGSFTSADIDRELSLVLRQDKKRRSDALIRKEKEKKSYGDRRMSGRWHVLKADLEFVDLAGTDESPFSIRLPLGLDEIVGIPPKAVIVLAGSNNAGKTALALNLLRMNFDEGLPLLYLMSEMEPTEYRQRVALFGGTLPAWQQNVKGVGNGYVVTFSDKKVYFAGDTENIPEMKALKGIDVAFLPMNLPFTMTPEMVIEAAKAFRPQVIYPYHYGQTDPSTLLNLMESEPDIEVRIRSLR